MEQVATILLPAVQEHPLYPAIFLAFGTGLRRGELLALRWQDIDLDTGTVTVKQTLVRTTIHEAGGKARKTQLVFQEPKTPQSRRTIPITEACLIALRHHKARQAEEKLLLGQAYENYGLVFSQPNGRPIDPRNFIRTFEKILRQAGLPPIRFHDARHTRL